MIVLEPVFVLYIREQENNKVKLELDASLGSEETFLSIRGAAPMH